MKRMRYRLPSFGRRVANIAGCLFLWVTLIVGLTGLAVADESLPEREQVEQRLAELQPEEGVPPSTAIENDIQALQAVLSMLEQIVQTEERLANINQRVERAPEQLLRLERELAEEDSGDAVVSATDLDDLPLERL